MGINWNNLEALQNVFNDTKTPLHIQALETLFSESSSLIIFKPKVQPIIFPIMANQLVDIMDEIVAATYAPLVFPKKFNRLPDDYLKHLPKFNGEGETIA